jgi:MerR family transcriptional regulator, copper efflux regulator
VEEAKEDEMTLTVGKLARAARVGVETIRFYERRGLVEPATRLPSGYRIYSETAVSRIGFIRKAQRLGFTLNEIGELMDLEADAKANCGVVRTRALDKIAAVEQKISDLVRMKEALEGLARSCDGNRLMKDCPLMDCLGDPAGCDG